LLGEHLARLYDSYLLSKPKVVLGHEALYSCLA
jgi:hypothetical protein